MRMPFIEFVSNGDLKFTIVYVVLISIAIYHFLKKISAKNHTNFDDLIEYHNVKIAKTAFWVLMSSILSLLLAFLHSLYFIGQTDLVAPNILSQGFSFALISPVMGIVAYMLCKALQQSFNVKKSEV